MSAFVNSFAEDPKLLRVSNADERFLLGLMIFGLILPVLQGLDGSLWRVKLISSATDGAGNVTGRLHGAVSILPAECLPCFYCMWRANHQVYLVVQGVMKTAVKLSFRFPLLVLIL